jgi:membrane protease YdiL (CAAX protease family)
MFIPATAAIICIIYFKSSALTRESKIVFTFFLLYVVLFSFENYYQPVMGSVMDQPVLSTIVAVLGMLAVILLNLKKKWRNGLKASKLSFGRNRKYYLILPLTVLLILIFQGIIVYFSGLGAPAAEFNIYTFFITLIPYLIFSFFTIWAWYFGEEFGWRVYLQDRLFPLLGSYKGVLVLGIIWGAWHYPMNAMGYNFPGHPILGNVLMTIFTIVMGIILSYAVLKTGSVWAAIIIHLFNNKAGNIVAAYLAYSSNGLLGNIMGSVLLGIFALILLRSKVWKRVEKVPKIQ